VPAREGFVVVERRAVITVATAVNVSGVRFIQAALKSPTATEVQY
jgi:hypothetical protein